MFHCIADTVGRDGETLRKLESCKKQEPTKFGHFGESYKPPSSGKHEGTIDAYNKGQVAHSEGGKLGNSLY